MGHARSGLGSVEDLEFENGKVDVVGDPTCQEGIKECGVESSMD
jgi:hypothetical protein